MVLGFGFLVSVQVLECVCGEYLTQSELQAQKPLLLTLRVVPLSAPLQMQGSVHDFPGFCYLKYLEEFSSIPFGP